MDEPEVDVLNELYRSKAKFHHRTAYCTAAKPLVLMRWNQRRPDEPEFTEIAVPEGQTLKIVMVSRFGDVGLTDNLDAESGYHIRVLPDGGDINNIRWNKEV